MKYDSIGQMVRGTFQCWATANDMIGSDNVEGCGAGGGMQALALARAAQYEWRDVAGAKELRVNLLLSGKFRARPGAPFTLAAPIAAELWSFLPYEGRVVIRAHEPLDRLTVRIPEETDLLSARIFRSMTRSVGRTPAVARRSEAAVQAEGKYAVLMKVAQGEEIEILFPLRTYETDETAAGKTYKVKWKGSSVIGLSPEGERLPLYKNRIHILNTQAPLSAPRYP